VSVRPLVAIGNKLLIDTDSTQLSADRWTIRGRVTQKSNIRNWCNSRGEGKLFNMTIVDESGEIRATGFNAECEKFYNLIEMNKVTSYLIV